MLKNFALVELGIEHKYFKLFDMDGKEFLPVSDFSKFLFNKIDYKNRKNVLVLCAQFLDFLEEAKKTETLKTKNNIEILKIYKELSLKAEQIDDKVLYEIGMSLDFNYMGINIWKKNIDVVFYFLGFCSHIYQTFFTNEKPSIEYKPHYINISHQKRCIANKQYETLHVMVRDYSSVFPNIAKRPEAFLKDYVKEQNNFPMLGLPILLKNSACYRDMALYALLSGTGMSIGKALSLSLNQIDMKQKKILFPSDGEVDQEIIEHNNMINGINSILNYDLAELKTPVKSVLTYDLLKLGKPLNNIFNYDLLKLGKPLNSILTYDLANLKKPVKNILLYDVTKIGDIVEKKNNGYSQYNTMEECFFIPELKEVFFSSLAKYMKYERSSEMKHQYLFQFLNKEQIGQPYMEVSREALNNNFKMSVKRTRMEIPEYQKIWSPYSLKHFYCVYLLNYFPLGNEYGFNMDVVKKIIGHDETHIEEQYKREKKEELMNEYEWLPIDFKRKIVDIENVTLKQLFNQFG